MIDTGLPTEMLTTTERLTAALPNIDRQHYRTSTDNTTEHPPTALLNLYDSTAESPPTALLNLYRQHQLNYRTSTDSTTEPLLDSITEPILSTASLKLCYRQHSQTCTVGNTEYLPTALPNIY